MSEIHKMIKDIKDFEELQKFANAQYTVLTAQSKKIEAIVSENNKLREDLETYKQKDLVTNALDTSQGTTQDAETVCLVQLAILKGKSALTELTLEETKKVEIYAKVLQLLKGKAEVDASNKAVKEIDTSQLLSLISTKKSVEQ